MTAPDVRALEEWAARAIRAAQCERQRFLYRWNDLGDNARAQCLADAAALTPLLEVVAAAQEYRHGEDPVSARLLAAVDTLERAMGERT